MSNKTNKYDSVKGSPSSGPDKGNQFPQLERVIIIGAGLGGMSCAQALRSSGFKGPIWIVGQEPHYPYDRPCLSKEFLKGDLEAPSLLTTTEWFSEEDVELITGDSVISMEASRGLVTLSSGTTLEGDWLVLATGARARVPQIAGVDLTGVLCLRDYEDALQLQKTITQGSRVVIVGGGLIGCEVATTAQNLGAEVTIIEHSDELLVRTLGRLFGQECRRSLINMGVKVYLDSGVASLEGTTSVSGVNLSNGDHVPADIVVLSIGAIPNIDLALSAGLNCSKGILVDGCGRTSYPRVLAAGDVASWPLTNGENRCLETFINTQQQATVVARTITGDPQPTPQLSRGWTSIAGLRIQVVGDMNTPGKDIIRKLPGADSLLAFRVSEGCIVGAISISSPREFGFAVKLVERGRLSMEQIKSLKDPALPLKDLVKNNNTNPLKLA